VYESYDLFNRYNKIHFFKAVKVVVYLENVVIEEVVAILSKEAGMLEEDIVNIDKCFV